MIDTFFGAVSPKMICPSSLSINRIHILRENIIGGHSAMDGKLGTDGNAFDISQASGDLCGENMVKHTIALGESLTSIAAKYGVTLDDLLSANPTLDTTAYYAGDTLCVPKTSGCEGVLYQVVRGDTFFIIAQKHNITVESLMNANPNAAPEKLAIGQILCIPTSCGASGTNGAAKTTYTIARGDSFISIAKSHNIALDDLLRANPTVNPEKLRAGQTVFLPINVTNNAANNQAYASSASSQGIIYVVHEGDTFFSIAQKNGITLAALMNANQGIIPEQLRTGQEIIVPITNSEQVFECDGTEYIIKTGDTFYDIAINNAISVEALESANPGVDPERLYVGQSICIPRIVLENENSSDSRSDRRSDKCPLKRYKICRGDTFFKIAEFLGCTIEQLELANPGIDPARLFIDEFLCVPDGSSEGTQGKSGERDSVKVSAVSSCGDDFTPHTIEKGDTLYAIAKQYGVTVESILDANKDADPERLIVGNTLCIPKKNETKPCNGIRYTVQKGDTFFTLASWNKLSLDDLIAANPGVDPEKLEVGQVICIPISNTNPSDAPKCGGATYTIIAGDTLYSIARKHCVTLSELASLNPDVNFEKIYAGQSICVPKAADETRDCPLTDSQLKGILETPIVPESFWDNPTVKDEATEEKPASVDNVKSVDSVNNVNNVINNVGNNVINNAGNNVVNHVIQSVAESVVQTRSHVLREGDTLFMISKKYGVSLAEIFAANPWLNPNRLVAGTNITIPAPTASNTNTNAVAQVSAVPSEDAACQGGSYTVEKGDSFYLIARRFGVELASLLAANPSVAPDKLKVGQVICLPQCQAGFATHVLGAGETYQDVLILYNLSYNALSQANPEADIMTLAQGQTVCIPPIGDKGKCENSALQPHVIQQGETLASIAATYHTTPALLLAANATLAPSDFFAGRIICLPPGASL